MKSVSGRDLAKILQQRGWVLLRVKGSHYVFSKQGHPARLSIPIHGNRELKLGLLKHLMKVAGIGEDEL